MNLDYLRKFHKESLSQCDRCGCLELKCNVTELKSIYKMEDLERLCNDCGNVANSFINYYGQKNQEDINLLNSYLVSGDRQIGIFAAKMNGGYGVMICQ